MNKKCAKVHSITTKENTVKKTEYDLYVEDVPADELNILICRFMMNIDMKKKDGGEYEPATR